MENIHKASDQPLPMLVNPVTGTTIGVAYNQQNIGQTIRPASTSLLTIDSRDRFKNYTELRLNIIESNVVVGHPERITWSVPNNWSPYDFSISKTESLMNGFITRLAVSDVTFPWVIPNINVKTAQILVNIDTVAVPDTTYLCELQPGFYSPSDIAEEITTFVQGLDPVGLANFVMTYGFDAGEPVFSYKTDNANSEVAFAPLQYQAPTMFTPIGGPPQVSVTYPYPTNTKQLFDILGFSIIEGELSEAGIGGPTFCQYTSYVDIVCSQLTNNQPLKDTSSSSQGRDALCRLYLNTPQAVLQTTRLNYTGGVGSDISGYIPPGCTPFIMYQQFSVPKYINWTPNQPLPGYLQFTVYDDQGHNINEALVPVSGRQSEIVGEEVTIEPLYINGTFPDWSMSILATEN